MIHYIRVGTGSWRAIDTTIISEDFGWKVDDKFKSWVKIYKEPIKLMGEDYDYVILKNFDKNEKLDCVVYGCTSGTIAAGYELIKKKINLLILI